MERKEEALTSNCSFMDVKPIMMDLPYPPVKVAEENKEYAEILSNNYAGAVSEMSAITQYINNENRLFCERCPLAKTILGIAMAEMIHLQKIGEMIHLLGGTIEFSVKQRNGRRQMWTPQYLKLPQSPRDMLLADIESEKAAISQYKAHMKLIDDNNVRAVLARIIQDEEYHIMILQTLMKEHYVRNSENMSI